MKKAHLGSMFMALAAALVFSVTTGVGTAAVQSVEEDRKALEALYNATGGASWSNSANWLSDEPLGEWRGVSTNADGRVTALLLSENNLTGAIPPALAALDALTRLDLYSNNLSGSIPADLGNLTNLEALNLSGNDLSGPIPLELGELTNLRELHLSNNGLSGEIPQALGGLTKLKDVFLSGNDLTGCIPQALEDMREVGYNDLGSLDLGVCGGTEEVSVPGAAGAPSLDPEPSSGACGAPSGESGLDLGWLALGLTLPGLALYRRNRR